MSEPQSARVDACQLQSNAFLTSVLNAATEVAIIVTDAEGRITVFNRGAELLLGYTADEVVGRLTLASFHLPAELESRGKALGAHLGHPIEGFRVLVEMPEQQSAERREWSYLHKHGEHIPVSLVVTAMRDSGGGITGYLGIAQNISERKQVEQELNQFKSTLDNTLDSVFMFDAETLRFFYANQGATRLTGYSLDELMRMTPCELMPGISVAHYRDLLAPMLNGKQDSVTFETVHRSKKGQNSPAEFFLQYIAPAGVPPRFVNIVRDISERKSAEVELRQSERRFRYMLETCPTAARISRAGRRESIFFNRRYAALINADPGRAAGVDPASFYVHPEDYADILNRLEQGEPVLDRLVELAIPGADNKWALASYFTIQYEGAPAVLEWLYDITDRKQTEIILLEQAQQTQAILDHMVDGLITIDQAGCVASFNLAAERIFGYTALEVLGRNVKMLMPNPHRDAHDRYLQNYRATGVARIIGIGREVEGLRKDGSLFPMELAVSEVTRQGAPLYVGMVRDISERKRMERMKTEFVSTVSHELRTPLTSISGALGLLVGGAMGSLPVQARELIEIAHKNSLRLTHMINDLLDMEKIAAGKMHFDIQPQALMPLVEQALEGNRAYGVNRQVNLALTREARDVEVRVDSQRLMQVLSNFLSNAIKYSPAGGTVEIAVREIDRQVRVEVTDHGPGVPEDFRPRIFQKFSQADSSDTRQKGGTGLGLAITKELVERMGGKVGFESVAGDGASFFFDLPIWDRFGPNADLASNSALADADTPRILVVDDDPDIAQLLGMLFTRAGYVVDTASNGSLALQALQQTRYAALTLDIMLPDISGLQIIRQVRESPATADLPIIVVSAKVEEGRLAIKGDISGIDWLAKPIDEAHLLAAVGNLAADPGTGLRVLHVEDDPDLHQVIRAMAGDRCEFTLATTLAEARDCLAREQFDVVLLDIGLPDGSGWDLLDLLQSRHPSSRIVVLSGSEITSGEASKVETTLLKSQMTSQDLLDALKSRILKSHANRSPA